MATQNPYRGGQLQDFLKNLEDKLKRNKGGFTAIGQDVGSRAFTLPSKVSGQILPSSATARPQPTITPAPELPVYEPQPEQQEENVFSEDRSQAAQFFDMVSNTSDAQNYGISTLQDGGVLLNDQQTIIYPNEGMSRTGDPYAYPVATMQDGSIRYSDGSFKQRSTGVSNMGDLQKQLFGGQEFPITQEYGVVNPMEPNAQNINTGTDIGARFEPLINPFSGATVLEVMQWDGERDPYKSNTKGYGNSILIQLPDGRRVRMSHLQSTPGFNAGDRIEAGQTIGVTGDTGNVTGPHLDLEIYDSGGQIQSPKDFFANFEPQVLGVQTQRDKNPPAQKDNVFRSSERQTQVPQRPQEIPTAREIMGQDIGNMAKSAGVNRDFGASELVAGDYKQAGINLGTQISNIGFEKDLPRLGISELAEGNIPSARVELGSTVASQGRKLNAPELNVSELIAGRITPQDFLSGLSKSLKEKTSLEVPQQQSFARTNEDMSQKVNQSGIGETIQNGMQNANDMIRNTLLPTENEKDFTFIKPAYAATVNAPLAEGEIQSGQVLGTQSKVPDKAPNPFATNSFPQSKVETKTSSKKSSAKESRNVFKAPTESYKKKIEEKKKKKESKKVSTTRSTSGFQSGFSGGSSGSKSAGGGGGGGSW